MHVAMRVAGRGTGGGGTTMLPLQRVMLLLMLLLLLLLLLLLMLLCVIIKSVQKMQPKKIRGKRTKTITTRNHKRPPGAGRR